MTTFDKPAFHPPADWFADPYGEIEKHHRSLPHWQQGAVLYFVTWRLADSLPKAKLDEWHTERNEWRRSHPEPWDAKTHEEYETRFTDRIEKYLDAGEGSCALRDPLIGQIVADALLFFDGQRYDTTAFVVMPNHVHALFRLRANQTLERLLKSWKGFTAREINRKLARYGTLWQEEYWDRLIRDGDHYWSCYEYILRNPERANLNVGDYILWTRPPDRRTDILVRHSESPG